MQSNQYDAEKKNKDIDSAIQVLQLLIKKQDTEILRSLFARFPASWRKSILETLKGCGQESLTAHLA